VGLLFTSPTCPHGHGRLRGYTVGSRLVVEGLLIILLVATGVVAATSTSGFAIYLVVAAIWIAGLVGIALLDFGVLRYRCATCGQAFRRRDLASRDRR